MADLKLQIKPLLPASQSPIISIGAGGIVNDAHLPAYRQAGFQVQGIYDLNQEQAWQTADAFGIHQVYASLEDAVAGATSKTVFDIAVPASAILNILPALPDGAAVLIQKPMGETLAEARKIRVLCQRKQLTAAINFQNALRALYPGGQIHH